MTGKDVYLQMTWSWPDKTWNILCSYCLQWNTSQSKFRNHYFLFLFVFSILSQLFLIWGCTFTWHYLQEATDPICFSTHVRCKPVLDYCLLHSCKRGNFLSNFAWQLFLSNVAWALFHWEWVINFYLDILDRLWALCLTWMPVDSNIAQKVAQCIISQFHECWPYTDVKRTLYVNKICGLLLSIYTGFIGFVFVYLCQVALRKHIFI